MSKSPRLTPEECFARDIPAAEHDAVLTMLSEAAHDPSCHKDQVHILAQDRMDAINVRAHGIFTRDGVEYRFILESGNWNGTVIEDWEGDKPFEPMEPTSWALQPKRSTIDEAILSGKGPFLIMKWDTVAGRAPYKEIPGSYAYDRFFQPGGKTESHYRDAAAKGGFDLVTLEEAQETRRRLEKATSPIPELSMGNEV